MDDTLGYYPFFCARLALGALRICSCLGNNRILEIRMSLIKDWLLRTKLP